MKLYIDFETYCDLDLKKVGAYKYINHPSFHPWCMAYAYDDEPIQLWKYGQNLPMELYEATHKKSSIYASNAEFEWLILNRLGFRKELTHRSFVDVMALTGTFGYPLSLDKYAKALGLEHGKTAGSTRLINKLCKQQKKTAFNLSGKWTPHTASEDFKQLYTYCINDVHIMRESVKRLPHDTLTEFEQFVWGHTMLQNSRGVCLDMPTVRSIVSIMKRFKVMNEKQLQIATGGSVQTGKQVAKIKEWIWEQGIKIPNLTKDTVSNYLLRNIPAEVRTVLLLREQLAHSSTAKFDRMLDMEVLDILYGMLKYFGAHTGRYAGTGVQLHNLPRASLKDPQLAIDAFNDRDDDILFNVYPDINATASKLIRPMIIARPDHKLIVSDYVSIENVLLHWCANDKKTVKEFKDGKDQYKTYASDWFGVPYEEVTKEQRQQAKPDVLGLGYGGGSNALMGVAAGYGVSLSSAQAEKRVDFYRRKKYPAVPKFWYAVYNRAILALQTGDVQIFLNDNIKIEFRKEGHYLTILLPSGRKLWYPEAKLNHTWTIMVKDRPVQMEGKISYMGVKNAQWMRVKTHPGFLVENIIQALARDILVYGAMCAEQAGYPILFSVHDELVAEVPDHGAANEKVFSTVICHKQQWARTLPLSAEGYEAQRYRKE